MNIVAGFIATERDLLCLDSSDSHRVQLSPCRFQMCVGVSSERQTCLIGVKLC